MSRSIRRSRLTLPTAAINRKRHTRLLPRSLAPTPVRQSRPPRLHQRQLCHHPVPRNRHHRLPWPRPLSRHQHRQNMHLTHPTIMSGTATNTSALATANMFIGRAEPGSSRRPLSWADSMAGKDSTRIGTGMCFATTGAVGFAEGGQWWVFTTRFKPRRTSLRSRPKRSYC